jgi:hypothetical protein
MDRIDRIKKLPVYCLLISSNHSFPAAFIFIEDVTVEVSNILFILSILFEFPAIPINSRLNSRLDTRRFPRLNFYFVPCR